MLVAATAVLVLVAGTTVATRVLVARTVGVRVAGMAVAVLVPVAATVVAVLVLVACTVRVTVPVAT